MAAGLNARCKSDPPMAKSGPIIVIDDDPDDQEMIDRILSRLSLVNQVKKFHDGEEALRYFRDTKDQPMVILCDINMPLMNGIELKRNIEDDIQLCRRNMPFVFLTTTANPEQILKAYDMSCQGFFIKGQTYGELKDTVIKIVTYWSCAEHAC